MAMKMPNAIDTVTSEESAMGTESESLWMDGAWVSRGNVRGVALTTRLNLTWYWNSFQYTALGQIG
jgi:hypothetical protein